MPKKINVALLKPNHDLAAQASGLAVATIQDFVNVATKEKADRFIKAFRAGRKVSLHTRCDNEKVIGKQ